ncbi:hypothetical protein JW960_18085 [candidate division KSB1 bacterium]|nr:hypothetical protein [candidate division KSB1 bacterium]
MSKYYFVMLIIVMSFMSSCSQLARILDPDKKPASSRNDVYVYTAYDSTGNVCAKGKLYFNNPDSSHFTGTWDIQAFKPTTQIGPQDGNGTFVGNRVDSEVQIDLSPNWRDNNVILIGTETGDKITGEWMWVTFIGPTSKGAFTLVSK